MRREDDSLVVVSAADRSYAMPLAVMLRSVVTHLDPGRGLVAYVLDDGLGSELRGKVRASLPGRVDLRWMKPPDGATSGLPLWGRMPATTYLRLLLPEMLDESVERALWLDADLLVLDDLSEVWDTNMEGRTVMAARDPFVPRLASPLGVAGWTELGLPPDAAYFNAGVLLVDLARWRSDDVSARSYAYLRRFAEDVCFYDQEALNAVLAGDWGRLDERWNKSVGAMRLGRTENGGGAGILHYSGRLKPWQHCGGSDWSSLYYEYVDRTAWKDWRATPTFTVKLLDLYQGSVLRKVLHPLEQRGLRYMVGWSRRETGKGPDG